MPLPYGSGPPWAPGGTPPPGIPPSPPPIAAAQPQTPPYVGNILVVNSSGNVSSLAFAFSANAGDGIVLYVSSPSAGALSATATYGGIAGDTFLLFPTSAASLNASTWALWMPELTGTNPTITVKSGTSEHIAVIAVQVVGANGNWFIDQIVSQHVGAGSTLIGGQVRTTSPNDLILIGGSVGSPPITSVPGYTFQSGTAVTGTSYNIFFAYTPAPVALWTVAGNVHFASSQAGAITIAIRTGVNAPSHIGPPALPLFPPGVKVIQPFPYSAPAVTTTSVTTLALTTTIGWGELDGSGALALLGLIITTGTGSLTGAGALASLGTTATEGLGFLGGLGALGTPGVSVSTGTANLAGAGAATSLALSVTTTYAQLMGAAVITGKGVSSTSAKAQLAPFVPAGVTLPEVVNIGLAFGPFGSWT